MTTKFDEKPSEGIKLAFRLSNGEETEHIFSKTSTVIVSHCLIHTQICWYHFAYNIVGAR